MPGIRGTKKLYKRIADRQKKAVQKVTIVGKASYNRRALTAGNSRPLLNSIVSNPFGRSKKGTYRYCDEITVPIGVLPGVYTYRTNSMWDPDFTGVGHQPLFRDVLTGIFGRYLVTGVKYKITNLNLNTIGMKWGLFATQDTTHNPSTVPFVDTLEKRGAGKWLYNLPNTSMQNNVITGYISNAKLLAVSKSKLQNEREYSAAIGNNPILQGYLSIYAEGLHYDVASPKFIVELEYDTIYYEPLTQAQN